MSGRGSCVIRGERRTDEGSSHVEGAILILLLDFDAGSLWSVEELVRQLSASRVEVIDGLDNLHAAGLVHRVDEFVFATRAASSFDRLEL